MTITYIRIKTTKTKPGDKTPYRKRGYIFEAVGEKVYTEKERKRYKDNTYKDRITNIVYLVERNGVLHLKSNCKKL